MYIGSEVIFPIQFKSDGLRIISIFTVFHRNLSLRMCRSPKVVRVSAIAVSLFADLLPPKGSSATAPKASGVDLLKEPSHRLAAFYSA